MLLALGIFLAGFLFSNFALMPLIARQGEEREVPDLKGLTLGGGLYLGKNTEFE